MAKKPARITVTLDAALCTEDIAFRLEADVPKVTRLLPRLSARGIEGVIFLLDDMARDPQLRAVAKHTIDVLEGYGAKLNAESAWYWKRQTAAVVAWTRHASGLSQLQLAKKTGIPRATLKLIEDPTSPVMPTAYEFSLIAGCCPAVRERFPSLFSLTGNTGQPTRLDVLLKEADWTLPAPE